MRLNLNIYGFGSTLLQILLKTSIKPNLYYEIKDRVDEEIFDGITVKKRPRKCKVYGSTSSKAKRDKLIELLHQRVQHHRDKFGTKEILDELKTMVVKPNGKTEHADDAHDDLVFSYLWALYVFYYGEDLVNRFRLMKTEIYTDDHYDETSYSLEEEYGYETTVDPDVFREPDDEIGTLIQDQMKYITSTKSYSYEEFKIKELNEDRKALEAIKRTPGGREAISKAYNVPVSYLEKQSNSGFIDISNDINKIFYGDADIGGGKLEDMFNLNDDTNNKGVVKGNLSDIFNRV